MVCRIQEKAVPALKVEPIMAALPFILVQRVLVELVDLRVARQEKVSKRQIIL